jgi:branched-chain amino acid transport system ATP-binding protein
MLQITDLHAGYGKLEILHSVSLAFERDRFTAILGPNGSGKSTLLKSIFGITRIFSGSIKLEGRELVGLSTEQIQQHRIAYVPQRQNVFTTMSVKDNLLLALRQIPRHQREPLLADAFDLFPILKKRTGQAAGQLSGGERQMLAMALGWLMQPRVMLLDEPTAGLAPVVVKEVFRTLQVLHENGMTLVVVEQNARSVLQWCEFVYVMREGQLAFQGTAAECLEDEETIKNYLGIWTADAKLTESNNV